MSHSGLRLLPGQWYGWQMLPGYDPPDIVPYFSPIQIIGVTPMKTGNRVLQLKSWNAGYAAGVQIFSVDLRIVKHTDDYLVAGFVTHGPESSDRAAVINTIGFRWLKRLFPEWEVPDPQIPGSDRDTVSRFLNERFADA